MRGTTNRHQEARRKRSPHDPPITPRTSHGKDCPEDDSRGQTPIERIFFDVVGREMNTQERDVLLRPAHRRFKS